MSAKKNEFGAFDPLAKVKESALMYLGYRDRTVKEMRTKLKSKGYPEEVIERVLIILSKSDLLNDERFAKNYSRSKIELRSWGPERLRVELYAKGIEKEQIEETIKNVYEEYSQYDLIRDLLAKRLKSKESTDKKDMKKHIDYLKRRGFQWDTIRGVISDIEKLYKD